MPWTFQLPGGGGQGVFPTREEAQRARRTDRDFRALVRGARLTEFGVGHGTVIDDIPDHFNMSFGAPVRSRTHLKELQKKHGCHDWEPVKDSPGSQLSRARLRKEHLA